jgi:predicted dehydrogenase
MLEAHRRHPEPVFACVFQHRFDSVYRYIKRLIEEGALGTLLTAGVQVRCLRTDEYYQADRWRGTWAEEGGAVLINQAIHFIDSLVWIMGGVETLSGFYTNRTHAESMETEDTATAALTFRSGALGTIEATCSSHLGWENTLSFHGTEGALDVRQGESLKVAFADEALQERVTAELAACRDEKQVEAGKSYYGPSHPSQIRDFVESIREGRAPYVTPASASHTVEVVLGIYRSHREGRRVRLPSPGQTSA